MTLEQQLLTLERTARPAGIDGIEVWFLRRRSGAESLTIVNKGEPTYRVFCEEHGGRTISRDQVLALLGNRKADIDWSVQSWVRETA